MYNKTLEQIITKTNLINAYEQISKNSSGLDEVGFKEFEKNLSKNINILIDDILNGKYTPEPIKKIEIKKEQSNELRPIGLSSIKDKIIQRVLYNELNDYFDKTFSNKSYAYRKNKSTIKAINRVTQYIQEKNYYILKTDIDNFFETINHDKLLIILDKQISDKKIIRLISLFLQTGGFKEFNFYEHELGVHQGDILSPLLSNIYLDTMDRWLDKFNIPFIRYADDFVILAPKEKIIINIKDKLEKLVPSKKLSDLFEEYGYRLTYSPIAKAKGF